MRKVRQHFPTAVIVQPPYDVLIACSRNDIAYQDAGKRLIDRPVLSLCEDQGSTNFCARWFLVYMLALRMVFFDDPWHRLWNDVLAAAKETGFYSTILITSIACNLSWGPWQGERWHIELAEGAKDWLRYGDTVLDILEKFMPRWLRDKGQSVTTESWKQTLQQMLDDIRTAEYLSKKGIKVAIARWFSWMEAMAWWTTQWTARLVIMVHLGMKLGFIT